MPFTRSGTSFWPGWSLSQRSKMSSLLVDLTRLGFSLKIAWKYPLTLPPACWDTSGLLVFAMLHLLPEHNAGRWKDCWRLPDNRLSPGPEGRPEPAAFCFTERPDSAETVVKNREPSAMFMP